MWHVITSVYRLSSNFLVQWFEWHRREIQKTVPFAKTAKGCGTETQPHLGHPPIAPLFLQ
jgi:hypothetical protein